MSNGLRRTTYQNIDEILFSAAQFDINASRITNLMYQTEGKDGDFKDNMEMDIQDFGGWDSP